jgi:hypothetical protein
MKARLRDSRSNLAMTSRALRLRQRASALFSSGRSLHPPVSTSMNSAMGAAGPR